MARYGGRIDTRSSRMNTTAQTAGTTRYTVVYYTFYPPWLHTILRFLYLLWTPPSTCATQSSLGAARVKLGLSVIVDMFI